ncbi:hypothetical protein SAMN05192559_104307 [Halobacillus karajensis]|uniref:hypothetical protein n=1 Tax=Halobacillus karajensis TaxID=195088 RepID=UPI0008A73CBD|nr:hypothetical protein [Halobacillus karajensis]SEH81969.1 hypothetical protein SAMN05192559_104307 [Halobacillus karajensis]
MSNRISAGGFNDKWEEFTEEEASHRRGQDVLELPSRKDAHKSKKEKKIWNISSLWMRFLLIILILLMGVLLSYRYWEDWFGRSFPKPSIIEKEVPYHERVTVER